MFLNFFFFFLYFFFIYYLFDQKCFRNSAGIIVTAAEGITTISVTFQSYRNKYNHIVFILKHLYGSVSPLNPLVLPRRWVFVMKAANRSAGWWGSDGGDKSHRCSGSFKDEGLIKKKCFNVHIDAPRPSTSSFLLFLFIPFFLLLQQCDVVLVYLQLL